MKYTIKNTTHRGKAFKVHGGMEIVKAGKTAVVDCQNELTDTQIAGFKDTGVIITLGAKPRTKKRTGLEAQAVKLDIEFTDDTSDDDLAAALKVAKAAK